MVTRVPNTPKMQVRCKDLVKDGVIVHVMMPPKMISKMVFIFSSVRPGWVNVLAMYQNQAAAAFELQVRQAPIPKVIC